MEAYFDEAEERIAFLEVLHAIGHETESLTLCLTYIDSFAQLLFWPRRESGRNFVEALGEFKLLRTSRSYTLSTRSAFIGRRRDSGRTWRLPLRPAFRDLNMSFWTCQSLKQGSRLP